MVTVSSEHKWFVRRCNKDNLVILGSGCVGSVHMQNNKMQCVLTYLLNFCSLGIPVIILSTVKINDLKIKFTIFVFIFFSRKSLYILKCLVKQKKLFE